MDYTELPFWRHNGVSTIDMLLIIQELVLSAPIREQYTPVVMSEFLYQVNHIKGEGYEFYDTLEETQDAIANGALEREGGWKEDDDRFEHVSCLHRALRTWFKQHGENTKPSLSSAKLLTSHMALLESVDPAIAPDEEVYMRTIDGDKRYFMKPDKVKGALVKLINKTNREITDIFLHAQSTAERIEKLVKLAGKLFLEYKTIHPFADGKGRTGRIMMAHVLQSVTLVGPNVLFVTGCSEDPPFVNREHYRCFENARKSADGVPRNLTALIIEGIYVGWGRVFDALEQQEKFHC